MGTLVLPHQQTTYKVDLHIHTPGSKDYCGNKSERGYRDLVTALRKANIDVIAVTDHNTFDGYIQLARYREETISLCDIAARRQDNILTDEIKEEAIYLSRLIILPGVEISCYPGIHIILIFSENIIGKVETFLCDTLGLKSAYKIGDPAMETLCNPLQIIEKAESEFGDNFLCLLPHAVSSKGVWNELEGIPRAQILIHSKVMAAQISNSDSISRIKNVFKQKEYSRSTPFSFVQASDYHGAATSEPGQPHSRIKCLAPFSFSKLKAAFFLPDEIENSYKFVKKELEEFCENKIQIPFQIQNTLDLDEDRKKELAALVCASINTPNTVLKINILNVPQDDPSPSNGRDALLELMKSVSSLLDPPGAIKYRLRVFAETPTRQTYCLLPRSGNGLRLLDGFCWIWGKNSTQKASAMEIECIVSENQFARYGENQKAALENSSTELLRMGHSLPAIPLMYRIEGNLSRVRPEGLEFEILDECPLPKQEQSNVEKVFEGYLEGNYAFIRMTPNLECGRLSDQHCYHRLSVPRFRSTNAFSDGSIRTVKECLLVGFGGSVYYVGKEIALFNGSPLFKIWLSEDQYPDPEERKNLLLGISIWLKSDFIAWYVSAVCQKNNLWLLLMNRMNLPFPNDFSKLKSASADAQTILALENNYLRDVEVLKKDKDKNNTKINEKTERHNELANNTMRKADKEIMQMINVTEKDRLAILKCLRDLHIFSYEKEGES